MRRIMSIWFPQLPLDRHARLGDPRLETAFAIITEIKNALRLTHLTQEAREAGLLEGMSAADARAICPSLLTEPSDFVRDDMLLRALRRWADRLSPWIALDVPDGLILDVTGCSHLFGGESIMGRHALAKLADMHITAKIGVADTKGAARALSRHNAEVISISAQGQLKDDLQYLPVEALAVPAKVSNDLRRVGLKTIGQLYTIKSSELARRFGLDLVNALSKTLGQIPDPVSPLAADPIFAARMNLPDPIGFKSDLDEVLTRLTQSVCSRLKASQLGARQFHLTIRCVDTGDHRLSIGFARPCFESGKVKQQFERPLNNLKIKYGADWFRLVAGRPEPIREHQRVLVGEEQDALEDLSQVITTLGNRLGFDRVRRFVPLDSHLPEREFATIEAADSRAVTQWPKPARHRPIRIFKPERLRTVEPGRPPKVFEWRKAQYRTHIALGPERLSSEWWKDVSHDVKDYWAVETQAGAKLWLMCRPRRQSISTHPPDWFVVGKFL